VRLLRPIRSYAHRLCVTACGSELHKAREELAEVAFDFSVESRIPVPPERFGDRAEAMERRA
jgi:hypothetical protein